MRILPFRRGDAPKARRPRIITVIPAHNEEDVIEQTLASLINQTRPSDAIVVMADNCEDRTVELASKYKGVTVIETVDNDLRKVGALSQAWERFGANGKFDYWFGVDADTTLDPQCLEQLENEIVENDQIGGVMARYTFDQNEAKGKGLFAKFLVRMQRFEFAGWVNDILHHKRRTYVLGGQATLFRVKALAEVAELNDRTSPWLETVQVEDMELTWQLEKGGWLALVSTSARAYVGPMFSLKTLWAQRRKWDAGTVQILRMYGFIPVTSYVWRQQGKMLLDFTIRFMFLFLLSAAIILNAWVWFWIWAAPPIFAVLLNMRVTWIMPNRTTTDTLFGLVLLIAEVYLWFRLIIWIVSWITQLTGQSYDGWGTQYKAEGKPTLSRGKA